MSRGILFTDGGARGNPGPAAFSAILYDEEMQLIDLDGGFEGHATNNFAEYSGLLLGMKLAAKNGITELTCNLDSELVVKQLNGQYKIKDENIKSFYSKIEKCFVNFKKLEVHHIPRSENKYADKLVNIILDTRNK